MNAIVLCLFSHALLAVGYSDQSNSFIVRNSWGKYWVCENTYDFCLKYEQASFFREIMGTVIFRMST